MDDDVNVMEFGVRPTLNDDDRDDAKQVLSVALSAIQRERGAADQSYLRGRNAFAITATIFAAAQAAFIASVGRESGGKVLLTAAERGEVLIPAAIAALLLLLALGLLIFWLDKPRDMKSIGALTLTDAWLSTSGQFKDTPVISALVTRAIQEESAWAASNESRRQALKFVGLTCGAAGLAALVELVVLYINLA